MLQSQPTPSAQLGQHFDTMSLSSQSQPAACGAGTQDRVPPVPLFADSGPGDSRQLPSLDIPALSQHDLLGTQDFATPVDQFGLEYDPKDAKRSPARLSPERAKRPRQGRSAGEALQSAGAAGIEAAPGFWHWQLIGLLPWVQWCCRCRHRGGRRATRRDCWLRRPSTRRILRQQPDSASHSSRALTAVLPQHFRRRRERGGLCGLEGSTPHPARAVAVQVGLVGCFGGADARGPWRVLHAKPGGALMACASTFRPGRQDFKEIGLLGQGNFSKVFRARHRFDGREYAIKRTQRAAAPDNPVFAQFIQVGTLPPPH